MAGEGAKKMKIIQSNIWSDLPIDIMNTIANSLHLVDQIRFRGVCKSWQAANIVKSANKLPWMMAYRLNPYSCDCYLYDPTCKQTYSFRSRGLREYIGSADMLDSKHDWLLFSCTDHYVSKMLGRSICRFSLFFYTPFTDTIIEIPEFDAHESSKATFSTTPVSPDCVIFVISLHVERYCIRICRRGDQTWTEFWFDGNYEYVEDVECVNGVFYCSFSQKAAIGVFNVGLNEWRILPYPSIAANRRKLLDFLIESDGNLLLCHYDVHLDCFRVFRFDPSENMEWSEVEILEDKALLLIRSPRSISVEKGSELASTIHRFCSLSHSDTSFYIRKPSENHFAPEICDYLNWKNESMITKIWIQPPQL